MTKDIQRAFDCGAAFCKGLAFFREGRLAQDASRWITVHPGGKGTKANGEKRRGTPALIDDESGRILGGMGGKFTGLTLGEMKRSFTGPKRTAAQAKAQEEAARAKAQAAPTAPVAPAAAAGVGTVPGAAAQRKKELRAFAEKPENAEAIKALTGKYSAAELIKIGEKHGIDLSREGGATLTAAALVQHLGAEQATALVTKANARAAAASKAASTRKETAEKKARQEAEKKEASALDRAREAAKTASIPKDHARLQTPAKVVRETTRAVLIESDGQEMWLPKSQATVTGGYAIAVSDWAHREKGLRTSEVSAEYQEKEVARKRRQEEERAAALARIEAERPAAEAAEAARREELRRRAVAEKAARRARLEAARAEIQRVGEKEYEAAHPNWHWDIFHPEDVAAKRASEAAIAKARASSGIPEDRFDSLIKSGREWSSPDGTKKRTYFEADDVARAMGIKFVQDPVTKKMKACDGEGYPVSNNKTFSLLNGLSKVFLDHADGRFKQASGYGAPRLFSFSSDKPKWA